MKHATFLALALSLVSISSSIAQKRQIDSLQKLVSVTTQDTAKAKLLAQISTAYCNISPDSGTKYGDQALAISQRSQWHKGMALAFNAKGLNAMSVNDLRNAQQFFEQAFTINKDENNVLGMAHNKRNLGIVAAKGRLYPEAMRSDIEADKLYKKIGNKEGQCGVANNMGVIYLDLEQPAKALPHFERAYALAKELKSQREQAICLGNISAAKRMMKKYDEALADAGKALTLGKAIDDKYCIALAYKNRGQAQSEKGNYKEAFKDLRMSQTVSKSISDKYQQAQVLHALAWTHQRANSPADSAQTCFRAALQLDPRSAMDATAYRMHEMPPPPGGNPMLGEVEQIEKAAGK